MKIAICDDEILFLNEANRLLDKWAAIHSIPLSVYRFTNGDDLLTAHRRECMDLILLDVVMPLLNGIDVARELRVENRMVPIIFLTSTREFAVDSYDVKAFHYLLKPVSEDKFYAVMDDFLNTFGKPDETFTAQTHSGFFRINVSNIEYLEAQNKHVDVVLSNGVTIEIRELFSKCEEFFSPERGFFKCHRSYIVNLNAVNQFTKTEIILRNHTSIPIARNRYVLFKEFYFQHKF